MNLLQLSRSPGSNSGWRVLCEMFERLVSLVDEEEKKGFITRCRGFSIPLVCISKNAEEEVEEVVASPED